VPGTLKGWCEAVARFGTLSLADVMEPAIRHAARGYAATRYLVECISDAAPDLARDPLMAKRYLPDGSPLKAGARLVMGEYADTCAPSPRKGRTRFMAARWVAPSPTTSPAWVG